MLNLHALVKAFQKGEDDVLRGCTYFLVFCRRAWEADLLGFSARIKPPLVPVKCSPSAPKSSALPLPPPPFPAAWGLHSVH